MSKYIVRDVVCDWGICSVDDLGKEELVEVCNSKANAELICEILNTDLMKDGKYTIWKDQKISDLEAKLAEKDEQIERRVAVYEKNFIEQTDEIYKLKQQLAESESRFQAHKQNDARIIQDQLDLIENLEQQVKEKERQVAEYSDINNALNSGLQERCISCEEEHNQDKISFAVDILEELADCSNYINSKLDFECGSYVLEKAIRDKIKSLKGKKDE